MDTSKKRGGLAWLGLCALLGCSDGGEAGEGGAVGALALPLTIASEDALYRLKGSFAVRDATLDGGVTRQLRTDANPDATALRLALPEGSYSVLLEPGWALTRRDAAGETQVAARLVSDNPAWIHVRAGARSEAVFALQVADRTLTTGSGAADIDVTVEEAVCGNGEVEIGETCDDGEQNGGASWCDRSCLFRCDSEGCPLRVDPGASDAGDGESWERPLRNLPEALRMRREVWVRGGDFASLRGDTPIGVPAARKLRGGFAGHERTPEERVPSTPRTRLPGLALSEHEGRVLIERVVVGEGQPSGPAGFQMRLGLGVKDVPNEVRVVDATFIDSRIELENARVRLDRVDIVPTYDMPVRVIASHFAWRGGSLSGQQSYAGLSAHDSRVLLQKLDINGWLYMDGERSETLMVSSVVHDQRWRTGGGGGLLHLVDGILVDSTFANASSYGPASIEAKKLFVWNSSFLDLQAGYSRGSSARAAAIDADEVEIALSSFYQNTCLPAPEQCSVDVRGVTAVTASLFVQEDPGRSLGQPASDASWRSVDTREGLGGNCFTYAVGAFVADPWHPGPLLARAHPCPDAGDAIALERARRRLVQRVEPFRVAFFDADVARFSAPDWWRRETVREGRCNDVDAPDPGAHQPLPCPAK
ncbi:MAG: hypothetical protein ABW252_21680 [Polyangiales bacterium]